MPSPTPNGAPAVVAAEADNPTSDEDYKDCPKSPSEPEPEFSLLVLPRELLLHICSFIDAKFVIRNLAAVCKHLNSVINDNVFWKARIGKRLKKKYPAIPVVESEFNWKKACVSLEEQHRMWSNNAAGMDHFKYGDGIYAACDSVHLMQNGSLLAIGSRDRHLHLISVDKLNAEEENSAKKSKLVAKNDAHTGWIWSMSSLDNVLVTGSWDMKIKLWDVGQDLAEIRQMKTKSAVLCTHYENNALFAGGYDKKVYHFDPRISEMVCPPKRYHKQPVLSLLANDQFLITASEDKNIVVYDRRADAIFKTLTLAEYPMCMGAWQDQLWVGDKIGLIHLIDTTDGDFNIVETYDVGHKGKVTDIIQTTGALFTCSTDKTVKVLEPCLSPAQPKVITTLEQHIADMASITFQNDVLCGASSDCTVSIWKPKKH